MPVSSKLIIRKLRTARLPSRMRLRGDAHVRGSCRRFGRLRVALLGGLSAVLLLVAVVLQMGHPPRVATAVASETPSTTSTREPKVGICFGDSLDGALAQARQDNCRVMLYFYGLRGFYCNKIEQEVFTDPEVIGVAARAIPDFSGRPIRVLSGGKPIAAELPSVHRRPADREAAGFGSEGTGGGHRARFGNIMHVHNSSAP